MNLESFMEEYIAVMSIKEKKEVRTYRLIEDYKKDCFKRREEIKPSEQIKNKAIDAYLNQIGPLMEGGSDAVIVLQAKKRSVFEDNKLDNATLKGVYVQGKQLMPEKFRDSTLLHDILSKHYSKSEVTNSNIKKLMNSYE